MFATLATGTFRNSPWYLGHGSSLTILFSEDNLTCTMSRRGAVTLQSPKNWYQTRPQAVITVTVIHNSTRGMSYQKMESQRIEYMLEEDPLLNVGTLHNPLAAQTPQEVELDPDCDRTQARASTPGWAVTRLTHCVQCVSIKFGGHNISITKLLSRIICNCAYWKHSLALFFICTADF